MANTLILPEILGNIGKYLSKNDVLKCIRVCRLWKLVFGPYLWHTFTIKTTEAWKKKIEYPTIMPSLGLLELNAPYIRKLTVQDIVPTHGTFFRNCSQLQDLILSFDLSRPGYDEDEPLCDFLADTVKQLPRLQRIDIPTFHLSPTLSFLEVLLESPQLNSLKTHCNYFRGEATKMYMRVVSGKMRHVSSLGDNFDRAFAFPDDLTFPELRSLEIMNAGEMAIDTQLEWFRRCPTLISIRWDPYAYIPGTRQKNIPISRCRFIPAHAQLMVGSDNDFASTLHAYKLERLSFGELSMNTWRKHFSWLRDIDLMFCDALTSTMVQEILCSCPNLKSITAVELHYMDIAAFPQPWVCKGLQIFNIGITLIGAVSSGRVVLPHSRYEQEVLDEDVNAILSRAHRAIYGQIAQLVDLRNLRICNKHVEKLGQKNLLRPSLEFGLGALATLKQLEYFDCGEALVYVRLQESVQIVEWMVEHWASLKAIKRSVKPIFCLTDTEVHTTEAPERL